MTNQNRRQLYNDGYVQVFQEDFTLYARWIKDIVKVPAELQEYQKINLERRLDMVSKTIFKKPLTRMMISQIIMDDEQMLVTNLVQ